MSLSEQRTITTTLQKGLSIVATAFLMGIVGGAFAYARVATADHFALNNLGSEVKYIKADYVPRPELEPIKDNIEEIREDLKTLLKLHLK